MLSIESFVYRNFDPVNIYGTPASDYRVICPFCEDSKGHMHIAIDKPAVHCFRCGYSSSWTKLIMDMLSCDITRAIGELYKIPSMVDFNRLMENGMEYTKIASSGYVELPDDFIPLTGSKVKDYRPFKDYLIKRGFGPTYWKKYNLGTSVKHGCRIIIPIEYNYWQGRSLYNWMTPKYINPPNPSKLAIFNSKALDHYNEVVICEGAFSAMAVGDNAIALIGKEAPPEKMYRLLASNPNRFIIALEPDAFGTMQKVADALHSNGREVILWKYDKGDPADQGSTFQEIEYGFKAKMSLLIG